MFKHIRATKVQIKYAKTRAMCVLNSRVFIVSLTHIQPMIHFYTP